MATPWNLSRRLEIIGPGSRRARWTSPRALAAGGRRVEFPGEFGSLALDLGEWQADQGPFRGIHFADLSGVLHFDELGPAAPRLPQRRRGALTQLAASAAVHATLVVIAAVITTTLAPRAAPSRTDQQEPAVQRLVFLAQDLPQTGRGGGGGGNRQPGRIRSAQGVGSDTITLRVRKLPPTELPMTPALSPAVEEVPPLPAAVLEVKPLASGLFSQIGLPTVATSSDTSTGPGAGGQVAIRAGTSRGRAGRCAGDHHGRLLDPVNAVCSKGEEESATTEH